MARECSQRCDQRAIAQCPTQVKVKLRFDKVYYPAQVLEYYRVVWAAVDKQIFLDQSLD